MYWCIVSVIVLGVLSALLAACATFTEGGWMTTIRREHHRLRNKLRDLHDNLRYCHEELTGLDAGMTMVAVPYIDP